MKSNRQTTSPERYVSLLIDAAFKIVYCDEARWDSDQLDRIPDFIDPSPKLPIEVVQAL
ncbi:MAG: hypothetical protein ACI39U_01225 [Candidatus Cryptobacteroides sp.]